MACTEPVFLLFRREVVVMTAEQQQREQFLRDVSGAVSQWASPGAAASAVRWDESLEAAAQAAALARYPQDEAPVWARDSELTAAHLARRRATMDAWDYRAICLELGRLLAAELEAETPPPGSPSSAAARVAAERDDGEATSDTGSEHSSSRASDASEVSEVFETVDEQLVSVESARRTAFSLKDLQELAAAGRLQHFVVDDALAEAIADLSREETLAFLGLDDQTGAAALAAV